MDTIPNEMMHTTSTPHIALRIGTVADAVIVAELIRSVTVSESKPQETGFLLTADSEEQCRKLFELSTVRILEKDGSAIGFIVTSLPGSAGFARMQFYDPAIEWRDGSLRSGSPFSEELVLYVDKVVVEPSESRRGYGAYMYEQVLFQHPNHVVVAAVVERPFENTASALFHRALGFERVGVFRADQWSGYSGYQSGMYCRRPASEEDFAYAP